MYTPSTDPTSVMIIHVHVLNIEDTVKKRQVQLHVYILSNIFLKV